MNIKRLKELKKKLVEEKDLGKVWLFHMDHFADHLEFVQLGQPAHNPYLDAVILQSCQKMLGTTSPIYDFLLIEIPEYHFFHGPFKVGGRIGGVIYFDDIKKGLLAVSAKYPPTDEVMYLRFSEAMKLSDPHDRN